MEAVIHMLQLEVETPAPLASPLNEGLQISKVL